MGPDDSVRVRCVAGTLLAVKPRPRRRNLEPVSAASLIGATMARRGGDDRAREHRVFEAYETSAGAVLAQRSRPESLKEATLFVRTSSSAVAHQETLLLGEILGRMAQSLGPDEVTELRTCVGPLPAK